MKKQNYFAVLLASLLTLAGLTACSGDDEEGRKITNYQEYELTVASKQVLGMAYSCGNRHIRKLYAVKKDGAKDWKPLSHIQNFDCGEGYEYRIKISETSYLDYRMGEPAWTEYDLIEIKSKEKCESEGLPTNFLPDGYGCMNVDVRYVIEAGKKDEVEKRLMDKYLPFLTQQYVFNGGLAEFAMLNEDCENLVLAEGTLNRKTNDGKSFPDSYKLIPLEGQAMAKEQWTFLIGPAANKTTQTMDAFIISLPGSTGDDIRAQIWLYQDLTQLAQAAFPDAGVKTVVVVQVFGHTAIK